MQWRIAALIRFECSCGKRLKVHVAEIGRTVECPNCAAQLVVPDPDAPPVAEEVTSAPEAMVAAMRELAPAAAARPSKIAAKRTPPPRPSRSPAKPGAPAARKPSAATMPIIIGVAAAFVIVMLLVILAFFAGGNDSKPVKKEAPPVIQAPPPPPPPKPERNLHPPGDLFPKVAPTN